MFFMKKYMLCSGCFLLALLSLAGCRKFAESPAAIGSNPAYLRVFNVIPSTLTPFNAHAAVPFFTFLFDPKLDKSGIPYDGAIVGDWLGTRHLFATSYPLDEGNSLGASLDTLVTHNITYEYPGSAHVLTAPPINGYDLSAWAQVPSGKHRVQFIARPQTDTAFANLSDTIRKAVLIDTTIDLQPGEVYTLEAVSLDEDNNVYGAYLRQEQFTHQALSDSSMYVGFFNLSGKKSVVQQSNFPDTAQVFCTYHILDDITYNSNQTITYDIVSGLNNVLLTTLTQRMATTTTFLPLPLLPENDYFDAQNVFKVYGTVGNTTAFGTLPSVTFTFQDATPGSTNAHEVFCDLDPAMVNNIEPYLLINPATGSGQWLPNLTLFSSGVGKPQVYPSLTILEIVYGTVYMTQIQPAFYQQPN
jgi:hypothetical protein